MLVVLQAMSRRVGAVLDSDVLFGFRLRLFDRARQTSVSEACRVFGIHRSTYYRWRGPVLRSGLEMLRPRERRAPRMPNQTSQLVEGRIIAFSLGHPGLGPRRISASLAQERWGGLLVSPNGVWRVLRRHGLNRRIRRLSLVAGYAAPAEPERHPPAEVRHVAVDHPGELVGFDCFHVGRLSGTAGRVWQYTAIDLATSYTWAELHTTPLNPAARRTSDLARRVAADWSGRAATTARSSARPCSATRCVSWARPRPSSAPADRPPTAPSSASSARSSRSAGGRPSRDRWCPSSTACRGTWRATSATTTRSVPTPGA
jgi:transposase